MVQSPLRAALAIVMVLSSTSAAATRQPRLDEQYRELVDRYAGGVHVASVVEVLSLRAEDVKTAAVDALQEYARLYERSAVSRPDASPRDEDTARLYLQRLRAVAAMHLEAAVAVPPDLYTARQTHLSIAEAALGGLDAPRDKPWSRDPGIDAAARAEVARFRRDWLLIAATHFQRRGFLDGALGFARRALDEFRDQAVFHVVEGSIFEALAAPIATFDDSRVSAGLPPDESAAARAALQRAARSYERALVLQPDDAESRVRAARVYVLLGDLAAATKHLADEAPPGRLAYLLALARGHAAVAQRQYEVAVVHYRDALNTSHGWQSACIALAHALVKVGRQQEARDALRPCLSGEPAANDPWAAYAMGLEWLVAPTVRQLRARASRGASAPHD